MPGAGDFQTFFSRVGQCLEKWFKFNAAPLIGTGPGRHGSPWEYGAWLETESLQRYRHTRTESLPSQIRHFFNPIALLASPTVGHLERLGVLEIILKSIPPGQEVASLRRDIRRALAESGISLDLREQPPEFAPLEEPLLQREVIDQLLPRLDARFPARARELIAAYHDVVSGEAPDVVFRNAFNTLEAIARDLTGDPQFMFNQADLNRHFGGLHGTVHQTLIKLAAHRGDRGGHGRDGPEPHELRYLLFSICNVALLLLDCQGDGTI